MRLGTILLLLSSAAVALVGCKDEATPAGPTAAAATSTGTTAAAAPAAPPPAHVGKPTPPACAALVPAAELAKLTPATLQASTLPVALPDSGRWVKLMCNTTDYAFAVTVMCSSGGDALFNGELDIVKRGLGAKELPGLGRRALTGKIGSANQDGVWIWDDDSPCILSVSGDKDVQALATLIGKTLSPTTVVSR
jgi:hypothetical protein